MESNVRIEAVPVLMSLLPVAIQVAGLATLLVAVQEDLALTLIGVVLGLVWLKVTQSKLGDKYGELRAQRLQFIALGTWLGREDAEDRADRIFSETLMTDGGLEDESYKVATTADGIANVARRLASLLLQAYLLYAVWQWWVVQADL